jgi:hypothetical protein
MINHAPDLPRELTTSAKNVVSGMRNSQRTTLAGRGMDAVTGGLTALAGEAVRLPFNVLAVPIAKNINDATRSAVSGVLGITWGVVKNLPILPAPGGASHGADIRLASLHDAISTPLSRARDPWRRPWPSA